MAVPTRLSYLKDNLITSSSLLSSSDTATGYPLSNLIDNDLWAAWRSTDVSGSQEILISFAATSDVSFLGLGFHNITSSGTHLLKYGSTSACTGGTATLDMTETNFGYFAPSTLSYKFFKLSMNESVSDGYIEIGEMQIGLYSQVPYNPPAPIGMINNLEMDYISPPTNLRKYTRKGWGFNFMEDNTRNAYASLEDLWEDRGYDIPFFICPQPSTHPEDILFARFEAFDFHVDARDSRPGTIAVKEAN